MGHATFEEIKNRRLSTMDAEERAEFSEAYEQSRLTIDVDEKIRDAREAADGDQSSDSGSP